MFESIGQAFNSISSKTLKGALGNVVRSVCSSENNTLLSALAAQITSVRNNVDRSNQVLQLFATLADTISSTDDAIITPDKRIISDVTDRKDIVTDGCKFIKQRFGNMTFTDSFGLLYNFIFDEYVFIEDGVLYKSLLSTCTSPTSIDQCILYINMTTGALYVNAVVRTADFLTPDTPTLNNIELALKVTCYLSAISYNGTLVNGSDMTVLQYFQTFGGQGDTLYDLITSSAPIPQLRGKVRYLWDLIKEYMASSELNSVLADAVSVIVTGQENFKTWITTISAQIVNKIDCVKQFYNGLCDAYMNGGFKGAIMYVYEYFRTASSATDEDGLLIFTNNNNLVPIEYVVGMIGQVVSTAVAAAGAIVAYFQPIIGALVSLVGGVFYGIFKSINYDASATRCGIQMSDHVALNVAPYALSQGSIDLVFGTDLYKFANSTPIFCVDVPGGVLLCGPGNYADNKVTQLRYEFHPSLDNRLNAISAFANEVVTLNSSVSQSSYTYEVSFLTSGSSVKLSRNKLNYFLRNVYSNPDYIEDYIMANESNDRLSEQDDALMKKIILSNMWLFMYWINTITYPGTSITDITLNPTTLQYGYFFYYGRSATGSTINYDYNDMANGLIILSPLLSSDDSNPSITELNLSWENYVSEFFVHLDGVYWTVSPVVQVLKNQQYYGEPYSIPQQFDYALVPAKYNSETFLGWIILTAIVTIAVATITVAITMKVRKTIQQKRAEQNKKVESAWDEYKKGNISYDDYRSTVKSANRWRLLVGGTKYDYENYWNGDQSVNSSQSSNPQSTSSGILSVLNGPQDSISIDGEEVDSNELSTIIYRSIVGNSL